MPFDALTYNALAKELNNMLSGGKIERVGMPSKDDVFLLVRPLKTEKRGAFNLAVSVNPSRPGVYIADKPSENPLSAFSFLMHLRKHIGGGTINAVSAVKRERIIAFQITASDELGYKENYVLYVELLGKYANAILTDKDGKITDALKHVGFDDYSARAVLPGLTYSLPPVQKDKIPPDNRCGMEKLLDGFTGGKLADYLMAHVYGYAPLSLRQIVYDAFGTLEPSVIQVTDGKDKFFSAAAAMDEVLNPCVTVSDGKIKDCFIKPYTHTGAQFVPFPSISAAIDALYKSRTETGFLSGKTANLTSVVKNAMKKNEKSLAVYREKVLKSLDYEEDRIKGELLTANLYRLKTGMDKAETDNYYTGEKTVIKLDARLSPQANAQKYFKAYSKKKTAIEKSEEQIATAEEKQDYYESLLASLSNVENESDAAEIAAEMESAGLIKKSKDKKRRKPSSPITLTVDGLKVVIGKNNIQNDEIVKSSHGGWLWLHTQKIHGSHGVIQGENVPQDTINRVAAYVAHYSKASLSENVPVDYTLIKYVKKPAGSPPGKVIYTHQKTVNVKPVKP